MNVIIMWENSMSDFESGLLPALQNAFPPPFVRHGCTFHYCNAVLKWIRRHFLVIDFLVKFFCLRCQKVIEKVIDCRNKPSAICGEKVDGKKLVELSGTNTKCAIHVDRSGITDIAEHFIRTISCLAENRCFRYSATYVFCSDFAYGNVMLSRYFNCVNTRTYVA